MERNAKMTAGTYRRVVVKVGSSLITDKDNCLDFNFLGGVCREIGSLIKEGREVVVVSSGAIACGMKLFGLKLRPKELAFLQASAAAGQGLLMSAYGECFTRQGLRSAQILLTWDDFDDRKRYINAKNTLDKLSKLGAVPVINENDTVATDEIKFGDNDRLCALVACMFGADLLLILSDVQGLYRNLASKDVIPFIDEVTPDIEKLACGSAKEKCVGGMSTKLNAVKIASSSGIPCVITDGKINSVISRVALNREALGTFFAPKIKGHSSRKNWIAYAAKPKGAIVVDSGAKEALAHGGKSLLKVGVRRIEGSFLSGDVVSLMDEEKRIFARGIVSCPAETLKDSGNNEFNKEVVHRDNLVIL